MFSKVCASISILGTVDIFFSQVWEGNIFNKKKEEEDVLAKVCFEVFISGRNISKSVLGNSWKIRWNSAVRDTVCKVIWGIEKRKESRVVYRIASVGVGGDLDSTTCDNCGKIYVFFFFTKRI